MIVVKWNMMEIKDLLDFRIWINISAQEIWDKIWNLPSMAQIWMEWEWIHLKSSKCSLVEEKVMNFKDLEDFKVLQEWVGWEEWKITHPLLKEELLNSKDLILVNLKMVIKISQTSILIDDIFNLLCFIYLLLKS